MGLPFLHIMGTEFLTAFIVDYLFKQAYIAKSLGKQRLSPSEAKGRFTYTISRYFLPPCQGQTCISVHYKRFQFPKLGFLSYSSAHCVCRYHVALFKTHFGNWDLRNQCKQMLLLWLLLLLLVIVLGFWPRNLSSSASIDETVAVTLLACK